MAAVISVGLDLKHVGLRGELERYFASQPDMRLQTSADTRGPGLIIMEVEDDPARTFAQVHALRSTSPATDIFLTSAHTDPHVLLEALRAEVKEFLLQPLQKAELDQALQRFRERHQSREPQQAKRGKLINLMGSKGGIGTTTIAVNLAISLQEADTQRTVVLVDLNQPFGDAALFLDFVDLDSAHTFGHIAKNPARLDSGFLRGVLSRHASELAVLPSAQTDDELGLLTPEVVEKTLELLQAEFDYIVLDSGHLLDDIAVATLRLAPPLYLVTTLALPALRNTRRFLDWLQANLDYTPENIKVIVNRDKSKNQEIFPEDFRDALAQQAFWSIPNDYSTTAKAINRGAPLSVIARHARITRSFRNFAAALAGGERKKPSRFSQFMRKGEG
jgi:pilus assembly protein CpaE